MGAVCAKSNQIKSNRDFIWKGRAGKRIRSRRATAQPLHGCEVECARSDARPGVAQLVARLLWEQDAAGSNPVTRTIKGL